MAFGIAGYGGGTLNMFRLPQSQGIDVAKTRHFQAFGG
jgi:hypothetical protein